MARNKVTVYVPVEVEIFDHCEDKVKAMQEVKRDLSNVKFETWSGMGYSFRKKKCRIRDIREQS